MLYNGHISIETTCSAGTCTSEVTDVEMSGKVAKRAASGQYAFIDPIALLKAWGFVVPDTLRIRWGNDEPLDGSGRIIRPVRDLERKIVRAPE